MSFRVAQTTRDLTIGSDEDTGLCEQRALVRSLACARDDNMCAAPHAAVLLGFDALDVRAEFAQFFVEMFVAAIDMINAAHLSDSFGLQSRQHQRG